MAEASPQIAGQCLCGAVTIRATPTRPHVEACHCTMCRRWGGSAFLGVQCGSEVEIAGEEHVTRYRSSDWAERGFCRHCGSNLFYRFLPANGYSFTAGLFADDAFQPLAEEIFIDEKPDYYAFAGNSEKRTGAEVIEEAKAQGFGFGS
jgi:hypothetical protein